MFFEKPVKERNIRKYCLNIPNDRQFTQQEVENFLNAIYLELQLHDGKQCSQYKTTKTSINITFSKDYEDGCLNILDVFSDIIKLLLEASSRTPSSSLLSEIISALTASEPTERRAPGFVG
nr:MAG TPA: hypothetical protein [Caudoviricetes sp.]DAY37568.1 MAG TPA: hypothetical protein [Caudoviricetes sp.]